MNNFALRAAIPLGIVSAVLLGSVAAAQTTTSPVISNIEVSPSSTSATISWTTNEPATGQVGYGQNSTSSPYEFSSEYHPLLTTSHMVTLNSLIASTTYNFAVMSGFGTTSTSTASTTSANNTFLTLSTVVTPTSTPTTTPTTTPSDLDNLIDRLEDLQDDFPSFASKIQNFINDLLGHDNGTSTPPTSGSARIDQDGQTRNAGGHIDFSGRGFAPEQTISIKRGGVSIGSAYADGGGNFSTGAMSVPTTAGSYTYTFTGDESGEVANAVITVQ